MDGTHHSPVMVQNISFLGVIINCAPLFDGSRFLKPYNRHIQQKPKTILFINKKCSVLI